MADILVSEDIRGPAIDKLRQTMQVDFEPQLWRSPDELKRRIRDARALIIRNQTQVSADVIAAASRLLIIGRAGAGLDNIDLDAATEQGIVVSNTPHENSVSVSELTLGLILALARRVPAADRHVRSGQWARHQYVGTELSGKRLGIVGFGHIGQLVAQRARALDLHIQAYAPSLESRASVLEKFHARWMPFERLVTQSDIISCHVPLTEETEGLFHYERFCRMKSTAFFVNTSRGGIVDERGLAQALKEGQLAGAALDVRQSEPPGASPLADMDNVILTPHIAAFTAEAQQRVVQNVCRDVALVLDGKAASNFSNFPIPTER